MAKRKLAAKQASLHFDGSTYEPKHDRKRLTGQWLAVFELMRDGRWRTLREIADAVGCMETSVSARLRDFRKQRFGGHTVHRQRRGDPKKGIHEYRLEVRT